MCGSRRGRRHGWEKDGKRNRSGRKKRERETGMGERKIERQERERERQGWERERERERERDRGEREKITNIKKFMEFYLVVLYSAERSEARQWIVARQVSCNNPLSCYNPVTRDKVGKKKIEREARWEREKDITSWDRIL